MRRSVCINVTLNPVSGPVSLRVDISVGPSALFKPVNSTYLNNGFSYIKLPGSTVPMLVGVQLTMCS